MSSCDWDRFRADVQGRIVAGAADQFARMTWNAERIAAAQREGLQTLLQHAFERSPFHRRRLAGIDITGIDPADLSALPVMTKAEMMDDLDEVFTDRGLTTAQSSRRLRPPAPNQSR